MYQRNVSQGDFRPHNIIIDYNPSIPTEARARFLDFAHSKELSPADWDYYFTIGDESSS
jgi:hypothetical protein